MPSGEPKPVAPERRREASTLKRAEPGLPPPTVPALALGRGITLLGVLRSLARAGVSVRVGVDSGDFVRWSRYYRRAGGPDIRTDSTASLAADLERLPLQEAVLFPCSDSEAVAVASLTSPLTDRFRSSCPAVDVQILLADKRRFAELLRRLDVQHPETIEITSIDDIASVTEERLSHFFLKPVDSESFSIRHGVKACRYTSKAQALALYERLADERTTFVLQEFITGPPTCHYFVDGFVDRHGEVRARFARRRIRVNPPDVGNSSAMVSIPLGEVAPAVASLDRILADLHYRGVFSAEFKRDPRDGVFKLLEINARPWWYIGFATACGVNVAAMAYWDALDHDVPTVTDYRVGRWCVFHRMDIQPGLADLRAGRLTAPALVKTWLLAEHPVFALNDLGPTAHMLARMPAAALRMLRHGMNR